MPYPRTEFRRTTAENISKHYGGVYALKNVTFALRPREVHAVMSKNGAGKSTLIKIPAKAAKPDGGRILVKSYSCRKGRQNESILRKLTSECSGKLKMSDDYILADRQIREEVQSLPEAAETYNRLTLPGVE